jgi:hypothetical protein
MERPPHDSGQKSTVSVEHRPVFLGKLAVAILTLLAMGLLGGCDRFPENGPTKSHIMPQDRPAEPREGVPHASSPDAKKPETGFMPPPPGIPPFPTGISEVKEEIVPVPVGPRRSPPR